MIYSGMPKLSLTFGAVRLLAEPSMFLSRKNMPGSYSLELKRNEISREPGSMRTMGIPCGERPLLLLWQTWVCSFRTPGPLVKNDNPFIDSFFRTLKYHAGYPRRFATIDEAWTVTNTHVANTNFLAQLLP